MDVYLLGSQRLISNNPYNLITLRCDLNLGQFDQAGFVIVPKLGKLVVHFLQPTHQSANNATTSNSITKTDCPMKPFMLVSRGR